MRLVHIVLLFCFIIWFFIGCLPNLLSTFKRLLKSSLKSLQDVLDLTANTKFPALSVNPYTCCWNTKQRKMGLYMWKWQHSAQAISFWRKCFCDVSHGSKQPHTKAVHKRQTGHKCSLQSICEWNHIQKWFWLK